MAEQWIIRVEGEDYGPADLETLREWKADGRVISTNPARHADVDLWQTAAEIPGLFEIERPLVQAEVSGQRSQVRDQQSAVSDHKLVAKPPTRNILVETFRIYFRGFLQFLGLACLSIVPVLCAELTSRFIDAAPNVNVDLRTLVAAAFGLCMFILRI